MRIRQRSNRRRRVQVRRRAELFHHVGFNRAKVFLILTREFACFIVVFREGGEQAAVVSMMEREWVKNMPRSSLISSRVPTSFPKWKLKKGIKKDEQRLRTQSRQSMNTHKTYTNNSPTVRWLRGRLSSRGIGSCSVAPTLGLPRISFFSYLSVSDNGRYTQLDMNVSFKTVSAELLLCALL